MWVADQWDTRSDGSGAAHSSAAITTSTEGWVTRALLLVRSQDPRVWPGNVFAFLSASQVVCAARLCLGIEASGHA